MSDDQHSITVTVEGKAHTLHLDDVDGLESRAFRLAMGMPLHAAVIRFSQGELDLIEFSAGIVWLLERRENPRLQLDEVLKRTTFKSLPKVDVDQEPEAEGDTPPPPPG